jgi:signal transduction histidine kinase
MSILHDADRARRVGLALAGVSGMAVVVGLALFVASGARFVDSFMLQNTTAATALVVAFALMVREQPNNGAVWVLGWSMVVLAVAQTLVLGIVEHGMAPLAPAGGAGALTFDDLPTWVAWLLHSQEYSWVVGWIPLMTLALLLFPDGHLPSRRWRPAVVAAFAGMALVTIPFLIAWLPHNRTGVVVRAYDEYPYTSLLHLADAVGGVLLAGAFAASVASLVVRHRHASGDARRQIRWVAMGGGLVGLAHLLWFVAIIDFDLAEQLVWAGVLASVPALVAAYAMAILRYRLYDIDIVISRSIVVAALGGFIAVVYIAVVVGVGRLVGAGDEADLGLQVVATAVVAVAFQPLRRRVRRWADGLVYGQRATPYEVLAQFSRQVANAGDEDDLQRIADLLAAGTGADPAVVWLRVGEELRPVAASGAVPPAPVVVRDAGELPDLDAPLAVPVRHEDELLGAVSITKPRSEPPTAQDEQLAERLASGLALVLRNARLTAELREHLDTLASSRQRIVRAQDEARRTIEGELRHGAHRQLVELETLLGLARTKATEAHADRTAALLEQLEGEADDAVRTLRGLAQGIYPPVLEAQGLLAALTAQAATSPVPVTVHAPGLVRQAPQVEAAVYFSVLEALQNAVKYAQASSVHVRLEQQNGHLRFEVSDDGIGFDTAATHHGSGLRGITDRLDTVGGTLEVRSAPGTGTRLRGALPAADTRRGGSPAPATQGV